MMQHPEKRIGTIEIMQPEELKLALSWAAEEGWNPGKWDDTAYYNADKNGVLMLKVDGKPAGCISVVRYPPDVAFIGLFIIKKEFREQGFGKQLWQHAINIVESYQTIGLYAVEKQLSRYTQWSQFQNNYKNLHLETTGIQRSEHETKNQMGLLLDSLTDISHDPKFFRKQIKAYDKSLLGINRGSLLKGLLSLTGAFSIITFNENSEISGYGIARPCQTGYRIGPLYANTLEDAKRITQQCFSHVGLKEKVVFDIPTINSFALTFANYFQLTNITASDTHAMFKGAIPTQFVKGNKKSYGLASLELG